MSSADAVAGQSIDVTHTSQAGNHVRDEVMSSFIRLVCHTVELQAYTVSKLFRALQADVSQEALTLVAVWILGEFGDSVLRSQSIGQAGDGSEEVRLT